MWFFIWNLPFAVILLESNENAGDVWWGSLQIHMLLTIIFIPIILNSIWTGKIYAYERQLIFNYLKSPYIYFISKLLTVWIILSSCLLFFYIILWASIPHIPYKVFLFTVQQIFLTLGFTIVLTGTLSLVLKRTLYSIIFIILYLLFSIQYLKSSVFAIWFNPNMLSTLIPNCSFGLKRLVLVFISLFLLYLSNLLFKKKVIA